MNKKHGTYSDILNGNLPDAIFDAKEWLRMVDTSIYELYACRSNDVMILVQRIGKKTDNYQLIISRDEGAQREFYQADDGSDTGRIEGLDSRPVNKEVLKKIFQHARNNAGAGLNE